MLLEKIKLEPNEKIIVQTRRHWFVLFSQLAVSIIMAIIPLPLFFFFNSVALDTTNYQSTIILIFLHIYFVWLAFMWIGAFNIWTNYYLDMLTITDRRIIVMNQKGFFWRLVASFRLERMQDIHVEVNGFIPTLLNYGTLNLETAGHNDEEFKITNIPAPDNIKSLILQASDNRISTTESHSTVAPV